MAKTTVNLADFADRVDERCIFLDQVTKSFLDGSTVSEAEVRLRQGSIRFCCEAYFLLSEAYKARRLRPDSRTRDTKIAALSMAAVSFVAPLRAIKPFDIKVPATHVASELLAVFIASSILNCNFSHLTNDLVYRLINYLHHVQPPALKPYIVQVAIGAKRSSDEFIMEISDQELAQLDALILICELLHNSDS